MRLSVSLVNKQLNEFGGARHDVPTLVNACRSVAKKHDCTPYEMYRFLCFNEPLTYTHSYGFHTAYGRSLCNELTNKYYKLLA